MDSELKISWSRHTRPAPPVKVELRFLMEFESPVSRPGLAEACVRSIIWQLRLQFRWASARDNRDCASLRSLLPGDAPWWRRGGGGGALRERWSPRWGRNNRERFRHP